MTQTAEHPIARLRSGLRGEVIGVDDAAYDESRRVWNGAIDRRPLAVAMCLDEADVQAAVGFAVAQGLALAVRSGAHSMSGASVVDDGLVVDLSRMNQVRVDPEARRAFVGGGALLGDVDAATQVHGLAVPAGLVSHTGVAGLTLGGGMGWLTRLGGLTIDNLCSARVVTADGEVRIASPSENADLFWAIRGGGGNFGVVTEFEFRAHELSVLPILAAFHPLERATEVLRIGQETMSAPDARDELLWTSFLRRGPAEAPWMTEALEGVPGIMSLIEWSGEIDEGRELLREIEHELDPPAGELADVPYLTIQSITDELLAPGTLHAYLKAGFAAALTDALIDRVIDRGSRVGSRLSVIEVLALGGAIDRVAPGETAFPHRGSQWLINIAGQWHDPAATEDEIAWVRETFAALEPHLTGGAYSNFMGDDEVQAAGVAYGATLERLQRIKAIYDPENVFRLNQNIEPAR
jgi:FAD/FMN-containing dehydrogenase